LTPTGFGVEPKTKYVFCVPCALTAGKATSETVIANNRNKAIVAAILFFGICNFLFSPIFLFFGGGQAFEKLPSPRQQDMTQNTYKIN
jgi:hypothetical protein